MAYIQFDENGNQINYAIDNNFTQNHGGNWKVAPEGFNPKNHIATLVGEDVNYTDRTVEERTPVKRHYIKKIVVPSAKSKDLFSINYKIDLLSGIRLEPEYTFTNDGFLSETKYYYEYNDENDIAKKDLVLVVTEDYVTNPEDESLNPSERAVVSRTKTWTWAFEDGTLDETFTKTKTKKYKTSAQQIRVGTKRRGNVIGTASEYIGLALVLLGVYPNRVAVQAEMREFARTHDHAMNPYQIYADTGIYAEIQNDTSHAWLDTVVPLSSALPAPLVPYKDIFDSKLVDMQGKSIRTYMIEKFKGNLV